MSISESYFYGTSSSLRTYDGSAFFYIGIPEIKIAILNTRHYQKPNRIYSHPTGLACFGKLLGKPYPYRYRPVDCLGIQVEKS